MPAARLRTFAIQGIEARISAYNACNETVHFAGGLPTLRFTATPISMCIYFMARPKQRICNTKGVLCTCIIVLRILDRIAYPIGIPQTRDVNRYIGDMKCRHPMSRNLLGFSMPESRLQAVIHGRCSTEF